MSTTREDQAGGEPLALLDDATIGVLASDVGAGRLAAVLEAFVEELARRAPLLQAALEGNDLAAIGRESHSIKGSALTFGAPALGCAARRANDACRAGETEVAISAAGDILALMPQTRDAVARLLANRMEVQPQ